MMFKAIITFSNGDNHTEEHSTDSVVRALQRLTYGPAARMGLITEVLVVDTLDCTNFHSKWDGSSMKILFPSPAPHLGGTA